MKHMLLIFRTTFQRVVEETSFDMFISETTLCDNPFLFSARIQSLSFCQFHPIPMTRRQSNFSFRARRGAARRSPEKLMIARIAPFNRRKGGRKENLKQ